LNHRIDLIVYFASIFLISSLFPFNAFSADLKEISGIQVISTPSEFSKENRYVINLESSLKPARPASYINNPVFKGHAIYIIGAKIKGRFWHRARLGFFGSVSEAKKLMEKIRKVYPGAWISKVSIQEISFVSGKKLAGTTTTRNKKTPLPSKKKRKFSSIIPKALRKTAPQSAIPVAMVNPKKNPSLTTGTVAATAPGKIARIFEEGRQAMAKGKYNRAVALYNKLVQLPETPDDIRRSSLEFLGLARDRKGQKSHARMQYKKYLELYPHGEGAKRVRQRLAGLETQTKTIIPRLRRAQKKKGGESLFFGSFSQFYRRDLNLTTNANNVTTNSALANDADMSFRNVGKVVLLDVRATAGITRNFLTKDFSDPSVSTFYVGLSDKQQKLSARIGRQSLSTSGIINRMDGLNLGYQITSWAKLNLAAGFPVERTTDFVDSPNKSLTGASFNLGTFANRFDFVPYIIDQHASSLIDRQAVGLETHYFDPKRTFFSLIDYDYFYNDINTILVLGNITLDKGISYRASADFRYSPSLSTSNAVLGQPTIQDLSVLKQTLNENQIYQLARDRTPRSQNYAIGMSYPLGKKYELSADLTLSALADVPATQGAPTIEGSRWDVNFSSQLIGNSLLINNDISIFGLRFTKTNTANSYSTSINSRFPFTRYFRVNPILKVDFRDNKRTAAQWIVSPELRIDYSWRRHLHFEMQTGGQWSHQNLPNVENQKTFFINVGYRNDF